jgi:predicted PurR-regulated permease PerM
MGQFTWSRPTLLVLVAVISAIFVSMIQHFLMTILLAGIFSAMFQPLYRRLVGWFRGRKNLASLTTLVMICLIVILPLFLLLSITAAQAISISNQVGPWISQRVQEPSYFQDLFDKIPFFEHIDAHRGEIFRKAGELVGRMSTFLLDSISDFTKATIGFLFLFFVFLYTMFFFLKDGSLVLEKILYYLPLTDNDESRLLDRFTSVTRATLKGTLVIGVIQGGAAGLAFWVVGIDGSVFWGTVMTVLSIIPAVGSALIWLPAVVILAAMGHILKAVGLLIFCGLVVGSVDNLLRPLMVGKDTQMHELFIFFGTLGGISLFGIIGFIIGPIIAALFVTIWDIYGQTFKEHLT